MIHYITSTVEIIGNKSPVAIIQGIYDNLVSLGNQCRT